MNQSVNRKIVKSLGWLEMKNYSAYGIPCLTYTEQPCYIYDIIKLKD